MTRPLRAVAWIGGLVAAGAALHVAGTGSLAAPPLASPGGLVDWVGARSPIAAAVALARLVAEVAVWYVVGVSVLHVVAGTARRRGAHRLADALAVPAVARLVRSGLGVGLVAASTLAPAGAAGPPAAGTATMVPHAGGAPSPAPAAAGASAPDPGAGTATMAPAPARPAAPPDRPVAAPPAATTWTVAPGESFWSIAEEVLADARGGPVPDAEVDPYWRTLVERNRGRLVDPDDADLLIPGQVLELPPRP